MLTGFKAAIINFNYISKRNICSAKRELTFDACFFFFLVVSKLTRKTTKCGGREGGDGTHPCPSDRQNVQEKSLKGHKGAAVFTPGGKVLCDHLTTAKKKKK